MACKNDIFFETCQTGWQMARACYHGNPVIFFLWKCHRWLLTYYRGFFRQFCPAGQVHQGAEVVIVQNIYPLSGLVTGAALQSSTGVNGQQIEHSAARLAGTLTPLSTAAASAKHRKRPISPPPSSTFLTPHLRHWF